MCGIAGKIDFRAAVDEDLLARMCAVIEHRGPDSRGIHRDQGAGLGIQRLAIIDRAGGDQPIYNEDRSVVVVMNGEIYNHDGLRTDLQRRGHRFATRADTEVLVHLYEEHGPGLVEHLRGMFAFALWDSQARRLLLGRDRAGKKPLFWARKGSSVWFASEVRSLLEDPQIGRQVNPEAIGAYLSYQYVPDPLCAFSGVQKLPPAHTLLITEEREVCERYWRLDYNRKYDAPAAELEDRLRAELWEATRIRLQSEVPLGAFLSGGLDSSAVVAAMADQMSEPVKTFSIGFPDAAFNETSYARVVAERFSTDHHEFEVQPHDVSILRKIALHYGEPYSDSSAIPSFYLSELAGQHVTVALNGDGSDESFAGYEAKYGAMERVAERFDRIPDPVRSAAAWAGRRLGEGAHSQTLRSRLSRRAQILGLPYEQRYARWSRTFAPGERARLLTPEFQRLAGDHDLVLDAWRKARASERVDRMLEVDVETYLPGDLLVKMDIATMAYSVEGRSPFLDHRLMEFAAALPVEQKLAAGQTKRILKSAMRGLLPDEIIDRPKMGFSVPLARWFRQDLKSLPEEILLDPRSLGRGYFVPAEVRRLLREHQSGQVDHWPRIWTLMQLEMWHRVVVEGE